jgi:hypothetical protein
MGIAIIVADEKHQAPGWPERLELHLSYNYLRERYFDALLISVVAAFCISANGTTKPCSGAMVATSSFIFCMSSYKSTVPA